MAPLISIITSTLNAEHPLACNIASLARQDKSLFEWIVVDGASTDGTLALLDRHASLVARRISEADSGIYDAWNKGCALARGEWLLFMGAGDEFTSPATLRAVADLLAGAHPAHDLAYGKLVYVSSGQRQELEEVGAPWSELRGRWELCRPALPPHPATFHHRSLFEGGAAFDPSYRIAGDSHFLLKHALRKPPLFLPLAISRSPIGGMSLNLGAAQALAREIRRMNRELRLTPPLGHRLAEDALLAAKSAVSKLPAPLAGRLADLGRKAMGQGKRWSVR